MHNKETGDVAVVDNKTLERSSHHVDIRCHSNSERRRENGTQRGALSPLDVFLLLIAPPHGWPRLLESLGIPLPGETILVCASVYAGTHYGLDIRVIIGAAACGAILGDNIGYWVGRSFGRTLLLKYGHYVGIGEQKLALDEYLFMRYGGAIVFFGRFVALLRGVRRATCGDQPSETGRLRPLQRSGGLVWVSTFGIGGYLLGKNLQHFVGPIGWVALAAFAVGSYFIWSFFKSHEKRFMADAERAIATRGVSPFRREIDR